MFKQAIPFDIQTILSTAEYFGGAWSVPQNPDLGDQAQMKKPLLLAVHASRPLHDADIEKTVPDQV